MTETLDEIQLLKQQIHQLKQENIKLSSSLENEKQIYKESLEKKSGLIDQMRLRLHRYEFSVKEAVLFLAKPSEFYDKWLQGKGSTPVSAVPTLSPTRDLADGSRARSVSAAPSNSHQQPSKQRDHSVPVPSKIPITLATVSEDHELHEAPNSDIVQALECMRLALSYLKNAQQAVGPVTVVGTDQPLPEPKHFKSTEVQTDFPVPQATTRSRMESDRRSAAPQKSNIVNSIVASTSLMDDDGDISSGFQENRQSQLKAKTCSQCREYLLETEKLKESIEKQKKDVVQLANLLDEEKASRERIQFSKNVLDQELEELTAQLFDQANNMVIEEARIRDELENSNKTLKTELSDWIFKFERREDEFKELKRSLAAIEAVKMRSAQSNPSSPFASSTNLRKSIPVDGILFQEFTELVQKIKTTVQFNSSVVLTSSFIKRCLHEDVEPCLFYSYCFPTSTIKAASINSSFKKKIMESACNLLIEIAQRTIIGNNKKSKCQMCGITRDCDSCFLIGPKPPKDALWYESCHFCTERLVAVNEFFSYIYKLRLTELGPNRQTSSLLGMYKSTFVLRKKMEMARISSTALLQESFSDWEKHVEIIN